MNTASTMRYSFYGPVENRKTAFNRDRRDCRRFVHPAVHPGFPIGWNRRSNILNCDADRYRLQPYALRASGNRIRIQALEKAPASGCRDETLVQLRSVVKSSKYLKSASIELGQNTTVDSGLVYRDKPRPDYVDDDGTMVWLNRQATCSDPSSTPFTSRAATSS